ncbi:MAG TPA: polysaccharide deacetylase family protein [Thermodesulfobacteriota bacterium]|nr:polysaccharide deacetylase family protein [Thermodesulfobacteriota bacterium]
MKAYLLTFSVLLFFLLGLPSSRGESREKEVSVRTTGIPILLYHRFGSVAVDSMTVTTAVFESQLQYLSHHGYAVISLRQLVDHIRGKGQAPPLKSLVITADDGHRSVYTDMFPLLRKYRVPATLFIYPSAISNASYAVTWGQLKEMKESGFFDFQSHTFWHPNFKKDKVRLIPSEYEHFVEMQLKKSREKLERELDIRVDMLAWPFGICNDELIHKALEAGYMATFTMERRHASPTDHIRSLPRYLITHSDKGAFEKIVTDVSRQSRVRLDRGSLPSETLKSGLFERGQPEDTAEGTVLRISFDNDQLALTNYQ